MNSRRKLDLREVSKEEKRFVINARKHANQLKNEPVPAYASPTPLHRAPIDIHMEIFSFMERSALLTSRLVCRRWAVLTSRAPVRVLDIPKNCPESHLSCLLGLFPNFRSLQLPCSFQLGLLFPLAELDLYRIPLDLSLVPDNLLLTFAQSASATRELRRVSIRFFEEYVRRRPNFSEHDSYREQLCEAYLKEGDLEAAEALTRETLARVDPLAKFSVSVMLGKILVEDRRFDEALQVFSTALLAPLAYFERSKCYLKMGGSKQLQLALDDVNNELGRSVFQPRADILFHRALIHIAMNQLSHAAADLEIVRALGQAEACSVHPLKVIRLQGDVHLQMKQYDRAQECFFKLLLETRNSDADAWHGLADSFAGQESWLSAAQAYTKSLELSRTGKQYYYCPSTLRRVTLDDDEEETTAQTDRDDDDEETPSSDTRNRLAIAARGRKLQLRADALFRLGCVEEALADLNEYVSLDPQHAAPYRARVSFLCDKLYRFEEALKDCEMLVRLKPNFASSWGAAAHAKLRLFRNQEALADINRGFALKFGHPELHTAALRCRSRILARLGRLDEAIADLRLICTPKPSADFYHLCDLLLQKGDSAAVESLIDQCKHSYRSLWLLVKLAQAKALGGNASAAKELFTRVADYKGDLPNMSEVLAVAHAKIETGDTKAALDLLLKRRCIDLEQSDHYWDSLAKCYWNLGKKDEAVPAIERLLLMRPDHPLWKTRLSEWKASKRTSS